MKITNNLILSLFHTKHRTFISTINTKHMINNSEANFDLLLNLNLNFGLAVNYSKNKTVMFSVIQCLREVLTIFYYFQKIRLRVS
jgi:hypothetical protein